MEAISKPKLIRYLI